MLGKLCGRVEPLPTRWIRSVQFLFQNRRLVHSQTKALPLRRSLFNVPGSDVRKMNKVLKLTHYPDVVVFDLEDGVPLSQKDLARKQVFQCLEDYDLGHCEKAVRINGIG